jgi:hypothetical protein
MAIRRIQFKHDVAVSIGTRDVFTITGYEADKHGKDLDVELSENWLTLYIKVDGKRRSDRRRIPMTSVAYIDETYDSVTVPAKAKP